ncbi:hypothetical protein VNO77_04793 [Canavalia gladiata]|uniref:Uncharacterized protein n=1 Tax=Canavalia gladiata TaxID=3824 RepID=A0AAN9RDK0_CANGL
MDHKTIISDMVFKCALNQICNDLEAKRSSAQISSHSKSNGKRSFIAHDLHIHQQMLHCIHNPLEKNAEKHKKN